MADPLEQARRGYVQELRFTAGVTSPAVVDAFATVPRERSLGPGPWRVKSPMRKLFDGSEPPGLSGERSIADGHHILPSRFL
jgi:hypothetical protein